MLLSTGLVISGNPVAAAEPTQAGLDFELPPTLSSPTLTSALRGSDLSPDVANSLTLSRLKVPPQAIAPPLSETDAHQPLPPPPAEPFTAALPPEIQAMFENGENSLVAIAVGSAEGTRTPEGDKTAAYYGHKDPGNGVWNLGSFSYQHGAASPEAADQQQLMQLKAQAQQLIQVAQTQGMTLSIQETLNGLDLANQSPAAAFSRGGYLDHLLEARQMGLPEVEAIVWARTRAFLDPDTRQWNAPGLGNTVEQISYDQERRMQAIAQTFARQALNSSWTQSRPSLESDKMLTLPTDAQALTNQVPPTQVVNQLLSLDLSPAP